MRHLVAAIHHLAQAMHVVSGVLLVLMVMTVLLEVLSRFVFGVTEGAVNVTIPGGVELVSFGLLFMILFALPFSVTRGQVIVDLFTEGFSERTKAVLSGAYTFGFALLGFAMAIRFFDAVARSFENGETSQDLLIPLSYIYGAAGFATAVLGLRALLVGLGHLARRRPSTESGPKR